jgi:hypothetical protein
MTTHRPFDTHTLQLLNAAVWFVESRRPNGRYEWRIVGEGGKLLPENKRAAVGVTSASGSPNHTHKGGARG